MAFSEESRVVFSLVSPAIMEDNPVLGNEETLLDGDKMVPLGSVNISDGLVPTLPSCCSDKSFDVPTAPTAPATDGSIPVDVG